MRTKRSLLVTLLATLILGAVPLFAQHGINVTWAQSTGCGSTPCTITKNSVYRGTSLTGPFTLVSTSATPSTSYLDPVTTSNQGTQACYVVTAWTTIESAQSSPAVCATFPVQATAPSGVSATSQ